MDLHRVNRLAIYHWTCCHGNMHLNDSISHITIPILDCKSKVYMAIRVNACDHDNLIIANSHNYSYSSMIVLSIIYSLIIMPILYNLCGSC